MCAMNWVFSTLDGVLSSFYVQLTRILIWFNKICHLYTARMTPICCTLERVAKFCLCIMCRDASKEHAKSFFFTVLWNYWPFKHVMYFCNAAKHILIWNIVILNARNLILAMQNSPEMRPKMNQPNCWSLLSTVTDCRNKLSHGMEQLKIKPV